MQYYLFLVLAIPAIIVSIFSIDSIFRHIKKVPADSLSDEILKWYMFIVIGFLVSNILELTLPTESLTKFFAQLDYVFLTTVSVFWFIFALAHSRRMSSVRMFRLWPLLIIPALTTLLAFTNDLHGLIWRRYEFVESGPFILLYARIYGLWFWIHAIYSYTLIILGVVLILAGFNNAQEVYRKQSIGMLIGVSIPTFFILLYVMRIFPDWKKDYTAILLAIAGIALVMAKYRFQFLELMPVAHNVILEHLSDGLIILDGSNRVVDINPKALQIMNISPTVSIGRQAQAVLPFWSQVSDFDKGEGVMVSGIEMPVNGVNKKYELRVSNFSEGIGRLIIIRDITLYKEAEETLQKSQAVLEEKIRERTAELTTLNATLEQRVLNRTHDLSTLYAVSSAASETRDLDDYLEESISRILNAMGCDAAVVYLVEEQIEEDSELLIKLVSHQSKSSSAFYQMQAQIEKKGVLAQVIQSNTVVRVSADLATLANTPRVVNSDSGEPQVDEMPISLLAAPMWVDRQVVGVLALARYFLPEFTIEDEKLLLTIANQIGLSITNYRLQKLTEQTKILEERQHLAANLHDTISQSLYGLMAFSEVGSRYLDQGDIKATQGVLERINSETRLAVKEFRLFLHNLRPIELEERGLVEAINLRLASVEGRSDVQTRLIAEGTIELPANSEEVLYIIAQEALNNCMRHAHAENVTVKLTQGVENVVMEIIDDGHGFAITDVSAGRLGLENMKKRAATVGGQVRVESMINQGTKVTVELPLPAK